MPFKIEDEAVKQIYNVFNTNSDLPSVVEPVVEILCMDPIIIFWWSVPHTFEIQLVCVCVWLGDN